MANSKKSTTLDGKNSRGESALNYAKSIIAEKNKQSKPKTKKSK